MMRQDYAPDQVAHKLREADRMLGEGGSLVKTCRHFMVTQQTYYRWRNQYGGGKADDAKRLKSPSLITLWVLIF